MCVEYLTESYRERIDTIPTRLMQTASGYGSKLRTDRMIQFYSGGPWRRVYAICYSNCASCYVLVNGTRKFLR